METFHRVRTQDDDTGSVPHFLVVGIGASAGGIHALTQFFEQVPAGSGIAYVVILHLSPEHESCLAEILQNVCALPVTQVLKEVPIEPDHVYVIPPNQHLTMRDGCIEVSLNASVEDRRAPVDLFFRTLAVARGPWAVSVILSGTGANGSMGMKRIKEFGGTAFVQDPREAEWDEMPRNAIATSLTDEILPVAEIPARIIAYKEQLRTIKVPQEPDKRAEEQQQALREIFTQLRLRTGHDFSSYKRPTLLRRIERRISVRALGDLSDYALFCRGNPDETQALLKDLLISVTNFFRDHGAFEYLGEEILPRILKGKKAQDCLRLWVVGCATGEEAYSLAMLCAECVQGMIDPPKLQIFATDIDWEAIAKAREGLYTINDAADVSPERLRRFFSGEGEHYRIRPEIRESILFTSHNVLRDPPFSHLDLIACRNMLIYFNNHAHQRVAETLHFALNPGGYLFLGSSESMDGASDLYAQVNREHHVFQSRALGRRQYPVPDSLPALRDKHSLSSSPHETPNRVSERIGYGDLHQQLLEQYAPPSLVVDEKYDVVHVSESAARFLQISGGEASSNLLKLIRQELRLELRTALYQATQRKTNVETRGLQVGIGGRIETINVHVRPVLRHSDPLNGFLLVLFEPGARAESDKENVFSSDEPVARQLEQELLRLKAELRASTERYESQAGELRASNEELQALNEELRSAAEELETSREELQSINEELTTVNQELKVKIEEVSQTSNNLRNLINSTDIATVFLDRAFRIHLFSPASRGIFNLISSDIGRPLTDITHKLEYAELLEDARNVLEKLLPVEREIHTTEGRDLLTRLSPYRTSDDRIQGVVATFTDITARKRAEEAVAADLQATMLLRDLSARLIVEGDTRVLYQEIMAAAIILTKADGGTVQVLDPDTEELVILASQGFDQDTRRRFHRLPAGSNTPCGLALGQNERAFADFSVSGSHDADGSMRMYIEAGYQSAQSTPLITRSGRPIGMVTTYWTKRHRPKDHQLRFLDLLARQASDLIEQRQADEALRQSRQDLAMELADTRKLQQISSQLILQDNVDALYQQVLEAALSLMHSEGGSIHMIDIEKNQLRLLTEKGLNLEAANFLEWVQVDSSSSCGMALARAERIIVTDIDGPEFTGGKEDLDFYRSSGFRASQSTPLISRGGRIVGVLSTHWRQPYHPSERELRLLDVLARQAADLIERKRTEEALRQSDRRKDEFLATLAHELRNPLAPIKSGLRIAHLKITADSPLKDIVQMMDRQADHLVRLVDDLLDVARVNSGKLELRRQRVALREAIALGIECIQPLIHARKHELVVDMGPEELFVEGDLDRLSQIFANLLSNAAKYTEERGRIGVSLAREEDQAVVKVTDTGVGIDAQDMKHVFDLFSQVTSAHRLKAGGLGIGLSLIRTLVQLHGGTIAAESRGLETGGSTFTVGLPLSQGKAPLALLPQPSPIKKDEASTLRILVVDDNVDAGIVLGMLLQTTGHIAEVVHSGKDAVKNAENALPDVIFLDLGMPEMDGIETARHLRALPGGDGIFLVALMGPGERSPANEGGRFRCPPC